MSYLDANVESLYVPKHPFSVPLLHHNGKGSTDAAESTDLGQTTAAGGA